jgi:hypothetical protein
LAQRCPEFILFPRLRERLSAVVIDGIINMPGGGITAESPPVAYSNNRL